MMTEEEFFQRLIGMVLSGEIEDKAALQKAKVRLARELKLPRLPGNSEVIARLDDDSFRKVEHILKRKPVRTLSGVAVVAVMTSPAPCPHGRCIYCPGGVENDSPQSYTGKEPAARRASHNQYDPYRQTRARIEQLEAIGHDTDKIDLIVMGGTFTSRSLEYQRSFVQGCFDAMNERPADTLETAHYYNEAAPHRCIGMTVETRPDSFDATMADHVMSLGTTRVEFGVQILDEGILRAVGRGHGVKEITEATRTAKEHGLKVCYHMMPGLPGSSAEMDVERFALMFQDERFMPDMLKIYPTLVIKGTPLYEMWQRGEYSPYDTTKATKVVAEMKRLVPRWARIQRIQRDIPVQLIEAGVDKSHLRELAREELKGRGQRCQCIRCREVGLMGIRRFEREEVVLSDTSYLASGGREHFLSLDLPEHDALVAFLRLRLGPKERDVAQVRELKVFGQMARIGQEGKEAQHRGFGRELMKVAEAKAKEEGYRSIAVTSGVGVRNYYTSMGYHRQGPYMVKMLGQD